MDMEAEGERELPMQGGWIYEVAVRPGLEALRIVWAPFLLCQLAAASVVVLFFTVPVFAEWSTQIAFLQEEGGLLFAALGSAFAGVVLPELAQRLVGARPAFRIGDLIFRLAFFAWIGIAVSIFYGAQALWIGDSADPLVILAKVLIDQLLFATLLMNPMAALLFAWQEGRFRWKPLQHELQDRFLVRRVFPLLLPGWAFWFPMVTCIYALPANIQYVFWLFVNAAWALLVVRLLREPGLRRGRVTPIEGLIDRA